MGASDWSRFRGREGTLLSLNLMFLFDSLAMSHGHVWTGFGVKTVVLSSLSARTSYDREGLPNQATWNHSLWCSPLSFARAGCFRVIVTSYALPFYFIINFAWILIYNCILSRCVWLLRMQLILGNIYALVLFMFWGMLHSVRNIA